MMASFNYWLLVMMFYLSLTLTRFSGAFIEHRFSIRYEQSINGHYIDTQVCSLKELTVFSEAGRSQLLNTDSMGAWCVDNLLDRYFEIVVLEKGQYIIFYFL